MDELFILADKECTCISLPNNIGANTQEMIDLYKEQFPYTIVDTIDGQCIQWDEEFIQKILNAMTTGSLAMLSDIEKQIWYHFVEFQDAMSHSATTDTLGAIGCTIPDINGNSYVVVKTGITSILCQAPQTSVSKERQSASLDEYLMDLYNCDTPNDCGIIEGDIVDISPCTIVV